MGVWSFSEAFRASPAGLIPIGMVCEVEVEQSLYVAEHAQEEVRHG